MKNEETIDIYGAREHNLKNIDLSIPRDRLVVFTGLSGSGKSSLAFDTIYAEGQRRYMETFSAYARQFIGGMERPDVDKIEGLSPVISIEQKTTSGNPRSTVGTITEIYDFLRLLYARASVAFSPVSGQPMVSHTDEQICQLIARDYASRRLSILAPVVRSRKGHYRELFESILKAGFLKARIDGQATDLTPGMRIDRYKTHDIEIVIDRLASPQADSPRLMEAVRTALYHGEGTMMVEDADSGELRYYSRHLMCPESGQSFPLPEPNTFSFNSPKGACPECGGLGEVLLIDLKKVIPDPRLSIRAGAIAPLGAYKNTWIFQQLEAIATRYGFTLNTPVKDIPEEAMHVILHGGSEHFSRLSEAGVTHDYQIDFQGIAAFIRQQAEDTESKTLARWAREFMNEVECPACHGSRLRDESLCFRIGGMNIAQVAALPLSELPQWYRKAWEGMNERQRSIAGEVFKELSSRTQFLLDVGLGYLSLDRGSKTLSGGESQRIRLATQIGSQLVGVLYILDEPSIGLHQRDNQRLISSLKKLRDAGNSVIVVEHDRDMILAADDIVDIGPGAGLYGGRVVWHGRPDQLRQAHTLTADYINGVRAIPRRHTPRPGSGQVLRLVGARGNNLKDVTVDFPLGKLICVTGVSGSGKSTLINDTLYPILNAHFFQALKKPLPYQRIEGLEYLDKVIAIDQSPIGRTPRSNPATYTGVFSEIRSLFAEVPEARIRGYKAGRFSFNIKGGRCEECQGSGLKTIEMNFLPDVHVHCPACQGKRYNRETLEVRYKGKSIADVLEMSIDEATEFFEPIPSIYRKIKTLQDVGLGYLTLGQQSTTLSGGEAQRVKLATELAKKDTGNTFYILDEPTTGLHFEDIRVLMGILDHLVDRGNTVLVIEHNLDVIRLADYLIDMGPEGGQEGGFVVAQGTPEEIVAQRKGYTWAFLKEVLEGEESHRG